MASTAQSSAAVAAAAEPVSTLPSGEAISSSSAPPASEKPSSTTPPLSAVAAAAPAQADALLAHLLRCAQTRAGADVVLMFLCYASRLGGSVLETLSRPALQHSARRLVAAAYKLPPAATVVLATAPSPPPAAALALQVAARLKAFSGMLSEWRTMGRLWGLLGMYFSAKKLLLKARTQTADDDPEKRAAARFDTVVAAVQLAAIVSFQAAENAAYLSSRKVLAFSPVAQRQLARWSVRSWAVYIGIELGRLLVDRSRKLKAGKDLAWQEEWNSSFTRNLSWAPLTLHWSMDQGPLPDLLVSLFAAYPATGAMRDLWRSTA